jgi:uncharacterized short protein YbdD (DUF466 family)
MIRDLTPEDYDKLVEALRTARHPIPLNEEQIKELAQRARIREVVRGDIVIQQGDEPDWPPLSYSWFIRLIRKPLYTSAPGRNC